MSSLHSRLYITFTLIGIIPYLFIFIYISYWQNGKIIESVKNDYKLTALHSKKMIANTLLSLDEEIEFLSKLEIMDDMLSNDLDFQISTILAQKSVRAKKKYIELFAINLNQEIIASSSIDLLNKKLHLNKSHNILSTYADSKYIYIIKNITASFDTRKLGYLVAKLNLKELDIYLLKEQTPIFKISYLNVNNKIKIFKEEDKLFYYGHVNLSEILKDFVITYSIDKTEVLKNLNDFLIYLFIVFCIGSFGILLISKKLTTIITKPIFSLQNASQKIIATKHYHLRIEPSGIKEFNDLTKSFNTLFQTTDLLFEQLQVENTQRLKNYIGLSETFNTISQVKSKDIVIDLTLSALRKNLNYEINIQDKYINEDSIKELFYEDFLNKKTKFIGYLCVENSLVLNDQELIFISSVTLMLKNQLEKISLLEKINSASSAKTAFISAMSHELRTPLNSIIGYSQYMINYEEMEDDQVDTLSKIETSAYHLLDIINDILDIAKIEAGKVDKTIQKMSVHKELQESIDIIEALVLDKGLGLKVDIHDILNTNINSDKKIFKQIIINIISNAIKFTNEGYISLIARKQKNTLTIEIIDTGIGIKSDDLVKIFDEFTQLKNAKKTQAKGSGLGLSLCKYLAKEIDIQIEITSEGLSKGSKATLTFNL